MAVAWQYLYGTGRWQRLRKHQLAIRPLCMFCLARA
jgi:hypothetical protein